MRINGANWGPFACAFPLTDEHFKRAAADPARAAQNAAQKLHETTGNDPKDEPDEPVEIALVSEDFKQFPEDSEILANYQVPEVGLEPTRVFKPSGF